MLADVISVVSAKNHISVVQDPVVSETDTQFTDHFVDALQSSQAVAVPLVVVFDVGCVLQREVRDPGRSGTGFIWVESCVSGDAGVLEEVFVAFGGDRRRLDGGGARVVAVDVVVDDVNVAVRGYRGDGEHEGLPGLDGVV